VKLFIWKSIPETGVLTYSSGKNYMKVAYSFKRRFLKWIIGGIACCLVFSIAWAAYRCETGRRAKPLSHFESNFSTVGPSMAIRGFTFDGNHEGRRTLSIKADSFIVDKKKIGFFRCGLMNTAKWMTTGKVGI